MAIDKPLLQLYLLGPPEVHLGERPLAFPTRKTLALLIYLAVEGGQQPRDLLAAMLWPEASSDRSYASLRNTLGHLHSALRDPGGQTQDSYLSVTHDTLGLNPDADIQLDLNIVEKAYRRALADRSSRTIAKNTASLSLLQPAASYNRGDFLSGFSLSDAPDFDDWTTIQRESWRRRLGLILDRLSETQYAKGEFAATAETASMWIALDGLNEAAYRRKMRAHFAAGERGLALDTYEACRSILAAELGVEPEPDTDVLAGRIRSRYVSQQATPRMQRPDTPVAFLANLFAGRTVEHQVLIERYEKAAAGQPQAVVLSGELGIGKTRLAKAFMLWAAGQNAHALEGRAFESGSRMSYQPLIDAFRPLLKLADTPLDLLGEPWLAFLSHLLPEIRMRYPELSTSFLEVNGGRMQLFESLMHLTLALTGRSPLVLFVDDLQWADSATLDWLMYAIRRWCDSGARILLLVSLRSEVLKPPAQLQQPSLIEWLARMEREIELVHLELGPLGEQDTVQMVASMLAPPADDFAEWIYNETRGHPFYLLESLKDLLERRVLHPKHQAEGQWVFEVDAEHDLGQAIRVPSTVRSVILSRLNRLSPNAFALLMAGAVLELGLTFDHLCAVANLAQDTGLPALDELVSSRLLLEVGHGAASAYAFAHHIIRDLVYTEAGEARRRLFHERALAVLESAGASPAVLAHHALAAGLAEAALRHSLSAGQEALHLSAASEAVAHLEHARWLAEEAIEQGIVSGPNLGDLYSQLGQAYEMNNQHKQAQAVYDKWQKLKES